VPNKLEHKAEANGLREVSAAEAMDERDVEDAAAPTVQLAERPARVDKVTRAQGEHARAEAWKREQVAAQKKDDSAQAMRDAEEEALAARLQRQDHSEESKSMARLRIEARAKQQEEAKAAKTAILRYDNIISFGDSSSSSNPAREQSLALKTKDVHSEDAFASAAEHRETANFEHEVRQAHAVAKARSTAGRLADEMIAHYNILSFDQDEGPTRHEAGPSDTPSKDAAKAAPALAGTTAAPPNPMTEPHQAPAAVATTNGVRAAAAGAHAAAASTSGTTSSHTTPAVHNSATGHSSARKSPASPLVSTAEAGALATAEPLAAAPTLAVATTAAKASAPAAVKASVLAAVKAPAPAAVKTAAGTSVAPPALVAPAVTSVVVKQPRRAVAAAGASSVASGANSLPRRPTAKEAPHKSAQLEWNGRGIPRF